MPLSTSQKNAVNTLSGVPGIDKKSAEKLLKQHGWDIQAAADSFFQSQHSSQRTNAHANTLNKLFDRYLDDLNTPDSLSLDGTQAYLSDLSIPLDDIRMLILSTVLKSPTLGTIPRSGFVEGWSAVGATDTTSQRNHITNLVNTIHSTKLADPSGKAGPDTVFRRVYKHTFTLALPEADNVRAVPLEEATEYWRVLLGPTSAGLPWVGPKHATPWIDWWLNFLQDRWKKAINRDLWNQTLAFAEKSLEDETLGFWSEEAAWPGVIDEFVEWVKEQRAGEGSMDTS